MAATSGGGASSSAAARARYSSAMRRSWTAATGLRVATACLRHSRAKSIKSLKVIAGVAEGDGPESHSAPGGESVLREQIQSASKKA
jgi:hypothetical protein